MQNGQKTSRWSMWSRIQHFTEFAECQLEIEGPWCGIILGGFLGCGMFRACPKVKFRPGFVSVLLWSFRRPWKDGWLGDPSGCYEYHQRCPHLMPTLVRKAPTSSRNIPNTWGNLALPIKARTRWWSHAASHGHLAPHSEGSWHLRTVTRWWPWPKCTSWSTCNSKCSNSKCELSKSAKNPTLCQNMNASKGLNSPRVPTFKAVVLEAQTAHQQICKAAARLRYSQFLPWSLGPQLSQPLPLYTSSTTWPFIPTTFNTLDMGTCLTKVYKGWNLGVGKLGHNWEMGGNPESYVGLKMGNEGLSHNVRPPQFWAGL